MGPEHSGRVPTDAADAPAVPGDCYDAPKYWDLAFDDDTSTEADFLEAAVSRFCTFPLRRVFEPGCGGGRLVVELATRGIAAEGIDLSAAAVEYAGGEIRRRGLSAVVRVGDMTDYSTSSPADVVSCLVNTFRHLPDDAAVSAFMRSSAAALRPGGLLIIGLHLFPPDADEEDEESWSAERDDVRVDVNLTVADCSREDRSETLRFDLDVRDGNREFRISSDYRMRLYSAADIRGVISRSPFELLATYDFWYDIDDPLELNDELGDTVLVLRRSD